MLKKWFNTCWPHLVLQALAFAFYSGQGLYLFSYLFAGPSGWVLTILYLIFVFPVLYLIISYSEKNFKDTPIQVAVASLAGSVAAMIFLILFSVFLQLYLGREVNFSASFQEGLRILAVILPLMIGGEIMRRILKEMNI